MVFPCHSFVDSLIKKCINVYIFFERDELINLDCLPILMLLYIMLAYLMLFAALFNAVCLYNAYFAIDFCRCFLLSCFSWFIYTLYKLLTSTSTFFRSICEIGFTC